jgi:predicted glycoside hydrolase/deacetylase ChbG (UPF0249 family)
VDHRVITVNANDSAQILGAAALVGGIIQRTSLTAGRTDTTDTAVNILAAVPLLDVGEGFTFTISNTAAQVLTIAGGTGVTASGNLTLNATAKQFFLQKTSATTMNLIGL